MFVCVCVHPEVGRYKAVLYHTYNPALQHCLYVHTYVYKMYAESRIAGTAWRHVKHPTA